MSRLDMSCRNMLWLLLSMLSTMTTEARNRRDHRSRQAGPREGRSGHMQLRQKCDGYSPGMNVIADAAQTERPHGSGDALPPTTRGEPE